LKATTGRPDDSIDLLPALSACGIQQLADVLIETVLFPSLKSGLAQTILRSEEAVGCSLAIFPGGIVRALARMASEYDEPLAHRGATESLRDRMLDFDGMRSRANALKTPSGLRVLTTFPT
jgi:hypothetical protein